MKEYTIKQAAEILEVSTSTIRRRIKSGKLAAEKRKTNYGQQYFIPAKELDRAITDKNVVDIQEVSKPISQEELKETLIQAVNDKQKALIDNAVNKIRQLPDTKIQEITDFADFLLSKIDDRIISENIQKLSSDSKSFEYLKYEEDLYDVNDLKERYK